MDFYKILNKNEHHHNIYYKFGLNIDPIKFNPSGDCKPGGIYFSREDILAFLEYGPWIRKVTIPEDAQIYKNPGKPKKWKADKVILGKKEKINLKVIKRLIDEGADPQVNDNFPIKWAIRNDFLKIVKLLLPLSDISVWNYYPLKIAVFKGYTNIVKQLLPQSNSKINDKFLILATERGHLDIVKLLIPLSKNKFQKSKALCISASMGHIKITKYLIPFSDPTYLNSKALRYAAENEHIEIVKLLLPVSKIDNTVIKYCKEYCNNQEILDLL